MLPFCFKYVKVLPTPIPRRKKNVMFTMYQFVAVVSLNDVGFLHPLCSWRNSASPFCSVFCWFGLLPKKKKANLFVHPGSFRSYFTWNHLLLLAFFPLFNTSAFASLQRESADAEMKVPLAENPELPKLVFFQKSGVDKNVALDNTCASPSNSKSAFLTFAFPSRSSF